MRRLKMPILPIVARSGQGIDSILELLKDDDLSTAQPLKILMKQQLNLHYQSCSITSNTNLIYQPNAIVLSQSNIY